MMAEPSKIDRELVAARLVPIVLVQLVSLRSLARYVLAHPLAAVGLAVVCGLCVWAAVRLLERRAAARVLHPLALALAVTLLLAAINAFVYPYADGLREVGRGSDQDDALIGGGWDLWRSGDPYAGTTYLGNPRSPGPGWVLLISPLALSGLYFLVFPASVLVLLLALRSTAAHPAPVAPAIAILLGGVGTWESMAVGGDLFPLGAALAAVLAWNARSVARGGRVVLQVTLLALLLTGRIVLPVLLVPWAWFERARGGTRRGLALAAGGAALVVAIHLPFLLQAGSTYMPAAVVAKGLGLLVQHPGVALAGGVAAIPAAVLLLRVAGRGTPAGLVLACAVVLTAPLLLVALADLAARELALTEWEGSNYLLVTLPLWVLWYGLVATRSATARRRRAPGDVDLTSGARGCETTKPLRVRTRRRIG